MRAARLAALGALLLLGGCELAEVTAADSEDVLVVEAVLSADDRPQHVLLHRSIGGNVVQGEPGAEVTVTGPDDAAYAFTPVALSACARLLPAGGSDVPDAPEDSLVAGGSCYEGPGELAVLPGATYELRVETERGETVRGRTTVPGDFDLIRPRTEDGPCRLRPRTNLPVEWSASPGAWSYVASLHLDGMAEGLGKEGIPGPNRLELTAVSVSERDTTLVVPSQFGLFEAGDLDPRLAAYLQGGLPDGAFGRVHVAAADRNYVNAVRGGAFNPSGSTRISSVIGDGVGVFGSIVVRPLFFVVTAFGEDFLPPCLPE
jgi:hypothetical protein